MSLSRLGKSIFGEKPSAIRDAPCSETAHADITPPPSAGLDLHAAEIEQNTLPTITPSSASPIPTPHEPNVLNCIYAGILGSASFLVTPIWFAATIVPGLLIGAGIGIFHKDETLKQGLQRGIGISAIPLFWTVANLQVVLGGKRRDLDEFAPTIAMAPLTSYEEKKSLAKKLINNAIALQKKACDLERKTVSVNTMTRDTYNSLLENIHSLYAKANKKYEKAYQLDPNNKFLIRSWSCTLALQNRVPFPNNEEYKHSAKTQEFISSQLPKSEYYQNYMMAKHLRTICTADFFKPPRSITEKEKKEIQINLNEARQKYAIAISKTSISADTKQEYRAGICETLLLAQKFPDMEMNTPEHDKQINQGLQIIQKYDSDWRIHFPRLSRLQNERLENYTEIIFTILSNQIPLEQIENITSISLARTLATFYTQNESVIISLQGYTETLQQFKDFFAEGSSTFTKTQELKFKFMILILRNVILAADPPQKEAIGKFYSRDSISLDLSLFKEETQKALQKYHNYSQLIEEMALRLHPELQEK